jgi:succinyl-CoA reductase
MRFASIDPTNGEVLREFSSSTEREVREAVERARRAQNDWWLGHNKSDRLAVLKAVESVFHRSSAELIGIIQKEIGMPKSTITSSYNGALNGVRYYSDRYAALGDRPFPLDPSGWPGTQATIRYEPHGVLGHIGIWNYPFWQTMITAIPALLAGNAIVFKPSEYTTLTGLRIGELMKEAGLPDGVFETVLGGAEVGKVLVRSNVDVLAFTGGIETGKDIARNAGIKPLILELSGNDAGIVCPDADLEQAARGVATGTFLRAGQVCVRIKRVYIHQDIAERFLRRLVEIASRLDLEGQVGPLIREGARDRVDRVVQEAVRGGASLLLGGQKRKGPGFYYEPTILLLEDEGAEVMSRETFGPVCSIKVVDDEDEAIRLANDSEYGLGATIWTLDMERADRIARRLQVGNVWINEWGRSVVCGEYFLGCKSSGIPSSQERLMMFLRKKTIIAHYTNEPRANWFK